MLRFYHDGQDALTPEFRGILEGVAPKFNGLNITSGYRDPEYNESVGGASGSRHQHGDAADIDMSGMSEEQRSELVRDLLGAGAKGFITYSNGDWLHVDMGSEARPDVHFMHDSSHANMSGAPDWFQSLSGEFQGVQVAQADTGGAVNPIDALLAMGEPEVAAANPIDDLLSMDTSAVDVYRDAVAMAPPAVQDQAGVTPQDAGGFDLTAKYARPGLEAIEAARDFVYGAETPFGAAGRAVPGLGMAALGGIQAATGAAAGLAGDVVQGFGAVNAGERLARDLAAMPEAFAGSPGPMVGGARARTSSAAGDSLPATRRAEPPIARPVSSAKVPERELGDLAYRAARGDAGAVDELAKLTNVDPAAAAAAGRLGVDVPADVLGTNTQIDELAGMIRTAKGTDASAAWNETVREASGRISDVLRGTGADPSADAASELVRQNLTDALNTASTTARAIYEDVGSQLPDGAVAAMPNTRKWLAEMMRDVRPENMQGITRRLYQTLTEGDGLTYTEMKNLRADLRKAKRGQGELKDASDWIVNGADAALAKDVEAHVGAVAGGKAEEAIRTANGLWRQRAELGETLTTGFGRDWSDSGSLAPKMRAAIASASKGDRNAMVKLLKAVPEELKRDTMLTAIWDSALAKTGDNIGSFSFGEYRKFWSGVERNPGIAAMIRDTVGPDAFQSLLDMGAVSKKIQKALDQTQAAKRTGASRTAQHFVDNMATRMMNTPAGRAATTGLATAGASAVGGPIAGGMAAATASGAKFGGKRAQVVAEFMSSPEFRGAAIEAARRGEVTAQTVDNLSKSKAFQAWAQHAGIGNPNNWIATAIAGSFAPEGTENDTN